MNRIIHTSAGVRDIFGDEYERKNIITNRINSLLGRYGYRKIQTPSIEFYPVFDKDKGTIHSSKLYKIIDKEGHTLVLRPDFTPSIARAVSMYFSDETMPLRLCYQGNVFLNNSNYRGRLNESTEMGVELINFDSPAADAELIALCADIMKSVGVEEFQISIGNVGIFNSIANKAGIDEEALLQIKHLLSVRNQFGAIELIDALSIDEPYKDALKKLPDLFGDYSVLERAEALIDDEGVSNDIKRLKLVYELLKEYECTQYVSFDLGMMSDFSYYTGIIFQAVTYGSGDAVIKGGRYNNFIEKFGKDAPAIGLTTLVDSILLALQHQKLLPEVPADGTMIVYSDTKETEAIAKARVYRALNKKVSIVPLESGKKIDRYLNLAKRDNCGKVILLKDNGTEEFEIVK